MALDEIGVKARELAQKVVDMYESVSNCGVCAEEIHTDECPVPEAEELLNILDSAEKEGDDLSKIRDIWLRSLPKELPHHTINLTVRRDAREKVFEADNLDEIAKLLFPEEKGDNAKA